jgi:hypothetical protein
MLVPHAERNACFCAALATKHTPGQNRAALACKRTAVYMWLRRCPKRVGWRECLACMHSIHVVQAPSPLAGEHLCSAQLLQPHIELQGNARARRPVLRAFKYTVVALRR